MTYGNAKSIKHNTKQTNQFFKKYHVLFANTHTGNCIDDLFLMSTLDSINYYE